VVSSDYGTEIVYDIARLLDHLAIARAHLFGYSMGGDIANKFRETFPDRLLSVTMGGAGLGTNRGWAAVEINFVEVADSLDRGEGLKPLLRLPGAIHEGYASGSEVDRENEALMADRNPKVLAALLRAYDQLDIRKERLSTNEIPTLLVVGEHDAELPSTRELHAKLANSTLAVVDGVNHFEAYKTEAFVSQVIAHLRRTAASSNQVNQKLDAVISGIASNEHVINAVASVEFGDGTPTWRAARGIADPTSKSPMTVAHQFRTASVAKTLTAVVVMQLIEQGRLSLDDSIAKYVDDICRTAGGSIEELHFANEVSHAKSITVRHLLSHTSGIPDYFLEKSQAGKFEGKAWFNIAWDDPQSTSAQEFINHDWKPPHGPLRYFFDNKLGTAAKFAPGSSFLYSDTNYLLLGVIVERVTGRSLPAVIRSNILDPLQMNETYYEWRENERGCGLAHHFMVLNDGQNHNVVAERLASSAEWANGGMVTTVGDLNCFVRALFTDKPVALFAKGATRSLMLDVTQSAKTREGMDGYSTDGVKYDAYTFGLERRMVLGRHECWGHSGFWGVGMFYFPKSGVSVVFTHNQVVQDVDKHLDEFVKVLDGLEL
ncbi:MAG: alpha/beta fold hydrolase, partial [Planctomycetales bacterium]|nr:alpha/beta fold hydrolase [Planctomycetales bacterium]